MKRSLLCGVVAAAIALAVSPAVAADIRFSTPISQGDFKSLSKEAGSAAGYRNMAPAAPLDMTGFDIGIEASFIGINNNSSYWKAAFNNDAPSYLVIPKLRARKGLPFGIDIGAMYAYVPDSNIKLYGVELSKAILDGTMATPAVGIRATYSQLAGVSDLGLQTYGFDASISKGFIILTPYAGAGILCVKSDPKGYLNSLNLHSETITTPRFFGGVKISPLPLLGITAEAEYAARLIFSLKASVSF